MMRKLLTMTVLAGFAALPTRAAPPDATGAARQAMRMAAPSATLVWRHAGGTTAWGNHWHAGGAGYYGRYPAYRYHGWGGAYHYGGWYRPPMVAPAPYYHPAGTFAAGAVLGGLAGAAVGAAAATASPPPAAATVYNYSQPPTVINNYYGGGK